MAGRKVCNASQQYSNCFTQVIVRLCTPKRLCKHISTHSHSNSFPTINEFSQKKVQVKDTRKAFKTEAVEQG
jgi:hypothetical protein